MRKPDWQTDDGSIRLFLGDCLSLRDELPKDAAIISDPPYGIAYKKGAGGGTAGYHGKKADSRNRDAIKGDDVPFDPSPWVEFGNVILWGADHFAQRLPHGRWLAWNKLGDKEPWDSFSDVEFAWHNRRGAARIITSLWKGMCQGAGEDKNTTRDHPTQKPVAVMRWCLTQAEAGDIVCDPYFGSGTTAIACIRTGRQFIGCEIDPTHFATAVRRIEAELNRHPLFDEPKPKQREFAIA